MTRNLFEILRLLAAVLIAGLAAFATSASTAEAVILFVLIHNTIEKYES